MTTVNAYNSWKILFKRIKKDCIQRYKTSKVERGELKGFLSVGRCEPFGKTSVERNKNTSINLKQTTTTKFLD